jgi:hypothetical protein
LETCVNEVRQKYWIPDLRVAVKKAKKRCQECKNREAKPIPPQMGDLPSAILSPFVPPFTYTGMDVLGPLEVVVGRSVQKRWVVLYTCLTSRAMHVEILRDLSTDACILAYRCFRSIRPTPKKVYCDNGTNFVGMSRELKRELKRALTEWSENLRQIVDSTADATLSAATEWCFNPPLSPHMGGSWERMVRIIKTILKVTLNNVKLREDTLRCFLLEAVYIVNSRPLTYLPVEPGMEPALTPNMLLKFSTRGDPPPGDFDMSEMSGRKQWRKAQHLADQFWKRWVKEVLPDLTRRTKWYKRTEPLKVDDQVHC